ncbi:MAG: molybdopterin-dependent oxidoreductase, partial [Actinomycetota bacterium]|nr:molybdopterin-dependent oxidoreductase [Actinomycetota bacterium]
MPGSILGTRVVRKEDPRFMTTGGVYTDDLRDVEALAGAATVVFVRSTVAHGTITSTETADARGMPGVVGVFTAADLELQPDAAPWNPMVARTLLASDRVRYVGEPVVIVVAAGPAQAVDAAEAVYVEYDLLEAYIDADAALAGSTLIYEGAPGNVVVDSVAYGMPDISGDEFFAGCDVTVTSRLVNQRVAPCPLETRASAATWIDGRLHQWVSSQHAQR